MKPTTGMKFWQRCDSLSRYIYDFDIYSGKETEQVEGTLGERVVTKLALTIKSSNVTLCFDRYFTSVQLLNNLQFPAVGTCMANKKKLPELKKKLEKKGDYKFYCSNTGLLLSQWKDTKNVVVISNCHKPNIDEIGRKQKHGKKINIPFPESIEFYNKYMGGVDLSDQLVGMYDVDRKSTKW